jgi:hypothetical protein
METQNRARGLLEWFLVAGMPTRQVIFEFTHRISHYSDGWSSSTHWNGGLEGVQMAFLPIFGFLWTLRASGCSGGRETTRGWNTH